MFCIRQDDPNSSRKVEKLQWIYEIILCKHNKESYFLEGYEIFYFPERNLAIIGFDSGSKIINLKERQPGRIFNMNINRALSELQKKEQNKEGTYPYRIAVFHHNPKSTPIFLGQPQMDYLETSLENVEAFYQGGIGIALHSHRQYGLHP
jgi:hypothetical protein